MRVPPRSGLVLLRCLLLGLLGAALVACGGPPPAPAAVQEAREAPAGQAVPPAEAAPAAPARSAAAEQIARSATWSPGQLQAHFAKHGREGPYATTAAFDASAREAIRVGQEFTYVDRTTQARRRGFYDPPSNRFTAVTDDGRRITTHFRPDNGERYVRDLPGTTYR